MKLNCLFAVFFVLFAPSTFGTNDAVVPLGRILKDPKTYHEKRVTTIGKIDLEFESQTLTDINCGPLKIKDADKVWVDISKVDLIKAGSPNHKNVRITGIFNSERKGHMTMFPGTLEMEKIEALKPDEDACTRKSK